MLLDTSLIFNENNSIQRVDIVKKLCRFSVSIVFLMCSIGAQADGLFDFQMKLAKKGNAEAEFKVGEMYETGFGVKKDMKEARSWINKAAAQGHETASFKLMYWDIEKNGLKGENKKKFADLRTKATDGNSQAMYYVGKMHAHGVGVKKNYDKALDWLNKATFVGVLEAEREAVLVREMKQNALAKNRKAKAQRKEKDKAAQEEAKKADEEKRLKAEAAKKQDAQKRMAEKKALEDKKKKAAAAATDQENEEVRKKQEAENKARQEAEQKKQALLKQKQAEEKRKKAKESKFESDPCKGKSARFLSTCR